MATSSKSATTKPEPKPAVRAKSVAHKPAKPATAQAGKPAAAVPAAAPKAAEKASDKAPKAKKPKLVRDSFTIPKSELDVVDTLKLRLARKGRPAKKSEILRAGLMALAALDDAQLLAVLARVPVLKTGRPGKA